MADLQSLLAYLKQTYPNLNFAYGKRFKYRYPNLITVENPKNSTTPPDFFALQTLHELGHALCNHKNYNQDISRLKIEREAWETAKTVYLKLPKPLQKTFIWDEDFIEASIDTYRDWLHQKSRCKKCGITRYQTMDGIYHCPHCENFTKS